KPLHGLDHAPASVTGQESPDPAHAAASEKAAPPLARLAAGLEEPQHRPGVGAAQPLLLGHRLPPVGGGTRRDQAHKPATNPTTSSPTVMSPASATRSNSLGQRPCQKPNVQGNPPPDPRTTSLDPTP